VAHFQIHLSAAEVAACQAIQERDGLLSQSAAIRAAVSREWARLKGRKVQKLKPDEQTCFDQAIGRGVHRAKTTRFVEPDTAEELAALADWLSGARGQAIFGGPRVALRYAVLVNQSRKAGQ
jgi:hypothetical protein